MALLFILLCGFAVFFLAAGVQWVLDQFRDSHRVIDEAPFPALPRTETPSNCRVPEQVRHG